MVEFLGIIITPDGSSMDKSKVEAIENWPTPSTVKQVQSFLGFANFLRLFIKDFSSMSRPLHNLTRKTTKWQWGNKEETAFQAIKQAICKEPVLRHPDNNKLYFHETNALGMAMGAVLSQQQEDRRLHPVGYMFKSFMDAKQNYNTHDKELLAIIKSLEHWCIFLEGTEWPITVFTNHLYLCLGIKPHFSSAYHPKSDGQMEQVNQPIKHFLCLYAGLEQDKWCKWLPMAEFSYNNTVHSVMCYEYYSFDLRKAKICVVE